MSGWAEYTYMTHYEIRESEPEQIPDHIAPESVGGPNRRPEPVDLESMTPEEATVAAFEHGDLIETTH